MGFALGVIVTVLILIIGYLINLERKHRKEREIKQDALEYVMLTDAVNWIKEQINEEYRQEGSFSNLIADAILNTFSYYHPTVSLYLDHQDTGVAVTLGCGSHTNEFFAPYDIPKDYLIHNWVYEV